MPAFPGNGKITRITQITEITSQLIQPGLGQGKITTIAQITEISKLPRLRPAQQQAMPPQAHGQCKRPGKLYPLPSCQQNLYALRSCQYW